MGLEKFEGMTKDELSMIEVSREILHEKGEPMAFADLTNEVQNFLEKSDEEIRERLPQFYTDLNIDGSFISLGDDDDVIDYDNDDPEDDDFADDDDDHQQDLKDYQNDLDDVDDGDDPQDDLPDGIEGQLNEFSDDDDE